jgi:L-serine dehydratase
MPFSVLKLFKIGVGPSLSHKLGPMTAAADFISRVAPLTPARVVAELFGSLALTGKGHATDCAIILANALMRANRPWTQKMA